MSYKASLITIQIVDLMKKKQIDVYVTLYIFFFSVLSDDPTTCRIESYRRQSI